MQSRTKFRDIKFIGSRTMTDDETGEVVECQTARIHDKDFNFQKFWISNIMSAIDELSNKKTKIVFYLMAESMRRSNMIVKTVREIAEEVGCSPTVVQETINILYRHDILRRKGHGARYFNPDVLWKGNGNKRQAVLLEYESAGQHDTFEPSKKRSDIVVIDENL